MDLANLDLKAGANAGAWIDIEHPVTRDPLGIRIKVLGRDSDAFAEIEEKRQREALEAAKQRKKPADPIAAAKELAEAVLVSCTVAWEGVELDGVELDCTPANVKAVYYRFAWLRDQVDVAIGTRANFLPS